MYFKVVSDDNKIIDAIDDDAVWIKFNKVVNMPLRCKKTEDPSGVLSSDGSIIYTTTEADGYQHVTLKEIDADKYKEIIDEVNKQREANRQAEIENIEEDEPIEVIDTTEKTQPNKNLVMLAKAILEVS